jgi:hypothetical protein
MFALKNRESGNYWSMDDFRGRGGKTTSEEGLQQTFSGRLVCGYPPKCEQQSDALTFPATTIDSISNIVSESRICAG